MPTPSIPLHLVKGHINKVDREARIKGEKALVTGVEMHLWSETKLNKVAAKHYTRLKELFGKIGKDDALVENTLNRYCMLLAEESEFEAENMRLHRLSETLDDKQGEMEFTDYITHAINITKAIQANAKQMLSVRRLLLAIERENLMTIAAQMRSIPKKADATNTAPSGIAAYRQKREEN